MTAADDAQPGVSALDAAVPRGDAAVLRGDASMPPGDASDLSADDAHGPGRGELIDWVLVALITVLTAWTAIVGIAFLPLYLGPVPFPISSLLGVGAMILAPRACYGLTGSMAAAAAPVVSWFGVSVWLVLSRNALINLPVTVYQGQWRVMVLLGLGSLAAAATVGLIWGDRLRDRIAAEQSSAKSD